MNDPSPLPATAEAVLKFLESVGRRSEAELYLKLFRGAPKESFAVIAAEAAVVRVALGSLLEQLRFLSALGLVAPVVVGLFDPHSADAGARHLEAQLPAAGLVPTVGTMTAPDLTARVRQQLRAERIPVLRYPAAGAGSTGDRFAALGMLAGALGSRKVVVVRSQGGLASGGNEPLRLEPGHELPTHGGSISVINLRTDLDGLRRSATLSSEDKALLEHTARLLSSAGNEPVTVSVTSPLTLLRELFTVKGAGTLIKTGSEILRASGYDELDSARIRALLEMSFGRRLRPEFWQRKPRAVYLEKGYRGVAIIEPATVAPYLTKFAVEPLARGEGLGQDIWQALTREQRSLVWRSRISNPVARWYAGVCDGMMRVDGWQIFWRGVSATDVPRAIAAAVAMPHDFIDGRSECVRSTQS